MGPEACKPTQAGTALHVEWGGDGGRAWMCPQTVSPPWNGFFGGGGLLRV